MTSPLIILQARTGSSRLPGKMTLPFFEGKCVLEIILERIKSALPDSQDSIVVATTVNSSDDAIADICSRLNVDCFRGSESDVLSRFVGCANKYGADKIIRVCADNVFLDMDALRLLRDRFSSAEDCDYMSFRKSDGTPSIRTHYGFWTEAVTLEALERVCSLTDEPLYHEHVTNYVYQNPDVFRCVFIPMDLTIENHADLRLTLDTADDFEVQKSIFSALSSRRQPLTPENILEYLDRHPEDYEIMKKSIMQNSK